MTTSIPLRQATFNNLNVHYSQAGYATISCDHNFPFRWSPNEHKDMAATNPHKDFADRLHQALDYAAFPTDPARTGRLAEEYGVSRETARKWLRGLSLPELERMLQLAIRQRISFEWLATGRGTMEGVDLEVREQPGKYEDAEELRLIGLVRKLPRKKRRALLQLLDVEQ